MDKAELYFMDRRMSRINKIDYSKLFIFVMLFVLIISMAHGIIDNSKYKVVRFSNSNFLIPQRIYDGLSRIDGDKYVYFESEDYYVLGIDPECEGIDVQLLERFNIVNDIFEKRKDIDKEYDLLSLLENVNGNIVYKGRTKKPSYDKYFIQLRCDDYDEIVLFFESDGRSVIEIIIAPQNDFSEKEIIKMHGNIRCR